MLDWRTPLIHIQSRVSALETYHWDVLSLGNGLPGSANLETAQLVWGSRLFVWSGNVRYVFQGLETHRQAQRWELEQRRR